MLKVKVVSLHLHVFLSMWTPGTKGLAKIYCDFYLRNIWTLLVEEGKKYQKIL